MSKKTKGRKRISHREQPQYLSLEPRQLLATITVDTVFDNSNPSDGRVSIREAVALANETAGNDRINFAPEIQNQTIRLRSELSITDSLFIAGNVTISGVGQTRLFFVDGTDVELRGLSLQFGAADQGGAVYVGQGSSLTAQNLSFWHNSSVSNGGAIFNDGGSLEIFHSNFLENQAGTNGGAIASQDGTTAVSRSFFNGNLAGEDGGSVSQESGILRVGRSTFVDNQSSTTGGAIVTGDSATGVILDSTFRENSSVSGGAIALDGSRLNLASEEGGRTVFRENSATENGGAVAVSSGVLDLNDRVFFVENTSGEQGAAIFASESRLELNDGRFIENYSSGDGGAVFATLNSRVAFDNAVFAKNRTLRLGGAVAVSGDSFLSVGVSTLFHWNGAHRGGAVYVADSNAYFTGTAEEKVTFVRNGAAINEVFFEGFGGAIYAENSNIELAFVLANRNAADRNGGGVYAASSNLIVSNSNFRNGDVGEAGPGIYLQSSNASISQTTFSGNTGNGESIDRPEFAITRSIVGPVFVDVESRLTIDSTDFARNRSAIVNYGLLRGSDLFFHGNGDSVTTAGAIWNFGRANLTDVVFRANFGSDFGGAVLNYGTLAIDSAEFSFNLIFPNAASGLGGAIASLDGTVFLSDVDFFGNQAENQGGAIYLENSELYGNNLRFGNDRFSNIAGAASTNEDLFSYRGGAIHVHGDSRLILSDTVFTNNLAAGAGGALAITSSDDSLAAPEVRIRDSVFSANSASLTNPAFYTILSAPKTLRHFLDVTLQTDRFDGGAIFLEAGELVILDSVFSDNFTLGEGDDIFNEGGQLTVR